MNRTSTRSPSEGGATNPAEGLYLVEPPCKLAYCRTETDHDVLHTPGHVSREAITADITRPWPWVTVGDVEHLWETASPDGDGHHADIVVAGTPGAYPVTRFRLT